MIIWGLFKKAVIASELATGLVDPVFFDPSAHSGDRPDRRDLWLRGADLRRLLGLFRHGDRAGRTARLSLSAQLRPALPGRSACRSSGGAGTSACPAGCATTSTSRSAASRGGFWATCRNLMITMVLGGLWHGAAWKFVTWGALHGTVLCIERIWTRFKPAFLPAAPKIIGLVVTFHIVCLAWIFFRADSFATAISFIQGFGRWDDSALAFTPMALGLIVFGLALHASPPRLIEGVAARARSTAGVGLWAFGRRAHPVHRRASPRGRPSLHLLPVLGTAACDRQPDPGARRSRRPDRPRPRRCAGPRP